MPSKIGGAHELLQDWANHGTRLRVGLFAIGLEAYWSQFPGLQQQLTGHAARVAQLLERSGVEVVNLGMIDSPEKALAAGHAFRRADVRSDCSSGSPAMPHGLHSCWSGPGSR